MIGIKFNGRDYSVSKGITILAAAQETQKLKQEFRQVELPTLYYLKGVNDIDDSGVCVVEVDGELVNASTTRIKDGMEILTNSEKVIAARKDALSKILAIHNRDCLHCLRSTSCELQSLLHEYGFTDEPELSRDNLEEIDTSSMVLVRDNNKCIRCKRCVNVCAKAQAVSAIACTGDGLDAVIAPSSPKGLAAASCVNCGQCIAVCPVGALTEKDETAAVWAALDNPNKVVVAQVAPAVRAALGESFEFPIGVDVEGRLPAALRKLGFDKVFDTKLAADLTIMEEVNELVERVKNGGVLPMITSCCPGWIKYAEHFYPDMLDNISTCKSPQQMLGSVIKSYYAKKAGLDKDSIVVVSIMPCVAKKFERARPELEGDVDIAITTRELARILRDAEIQLEAMPNEEFDSPLGTGTGAGVIFGNAGGVMEAALRTAKDSGVSVKTATVSGLANANALLTKIKSGEADYDFIEIMACPGGCVNGGGQPHQPASVCAKLNVPAERSCALKRNDEGSAVRKSHENPQVTELYDSFLGKAGGEKAHELLHTTYSKR